MDSIIASNRRPAPRLARPAERYWKGKLPKNVDNFQQNSDSEEETNEHEETDLVQDVPIGTVGSDEDDEAPPRSTVPAKGPQKTMNVALKDVKISSEGRVTVAGRTESGKTKQEEGMHLASFELLLILNACFRSGRGGGGNQ
jgi:microfibrillar-associated protein 1